MVDVGLDHETGLVVLKVKAFRGEDAFTLNERLLGLGEDLVNVLNERAEGKQVAEAERRVAQAEARCRKRAGAGRLSQPRGLDRSGASGAGALKSPTA
jgi:capsular polysaccharide transport system permease protein